MLTIFVKNVNDALVKGVRYLYQAGMKEESRNGPVLVSIMPVCTVYENPRQRVLLDPTRDANPFFHLMEFLWMMSGDAHVAFPAIFNQRMNDFANDDILHGAYGHRWRRHFGFDQLTEVIEILRENPNSRQAVVGMWDPLEDLNMGYKFNDLPCNTHLYFRVNNQRLDMTVCCRSNDIIWGAYGANAVHFSFLQEYMAFSLNLQVGSMYQISNNYHMYHEREDVKRLIPVLTDPNYMSPNYPQAWQPVPLFLNGEEGLPFPRVQWEEDLKTFFEHVNSDSTPIYSSPSSWFNLVAQPMLNAHRAYKKGWQADPIHESSKIADPAWERACTEWLTRRYKNA